MTHQYNVFTSSSFSDQADSIFSYWDKNMICRFANENFTKWFGKKPSELIGIITLKELLGSSYHLHLPFLKKVFEGKPQLYEYDMYLCFNGKQHVTAFYYPEMQNGSFSGLLLHISLSKSNLLSGLKGYKLNGIDELKNSQHFTSTNNKMQQVAQLLKTQLLSGFPSTEYLANTFLISISKLMRDFKSTFHTTPFIYYRNLQMEFAAQYMQETGCSKKQIALMLGFSNPGNFTSCFNKWVKEQRPILDHYYSIDTTTYHKWFISQLPIAIAMVDSAFNFLAVTNQWLMDFGLSDVDIINKNFFEFFSNQNQNWKEILKQCLNGKAKKGEEACYETINGKRIWFKRDIKPWYDDQKSIGGIIICTYNIQNHDTEHNQLHFEHQ
jgi:PAS domain S-box-containing protein